MRHLRLGQPALLASAPQPVGECKLHVDEATFIGRQVQEVTGIPNCPSGAFKRRRLSARMACSFGAPHHSLEFGQAPAALGEHAFGVAAVFLAKTSRMT